MKERRAGCTKASLSRIADARVWCCVVRGLVFCILPRFGLIGCVLFLGNPLLVWFTRDTKQENHQFGDSPNKTHPFVGYVFKGLAGSLLFSWPVDILAVSQCQHAVCFAKVWLDSSAVVCR